MKSCPECGSSKVAWENASELICKECGLILEEGMYAGERTIV